MRKLFIFVLIIILSVAVSLSTVAALDYIFNNQQKLVISPKPTPIPTPLAIYEVNNLAKNNYSSEKIIIEEKLLEEDDYTSYSFEHNFKPDTQNNKKVTGVVNIPSSTNKTSKYPLVFLIRGYVDREIYTQGMGTKNAAAFFAKNDFITIAPDYLGYGESDTESYDILESRYQTYTTTISLLDSLDSLENWDGKNIFIWAHSNGGQIALTTLAATGEGYPTTLWAPVTKPFPYSILYFTDELIDEGKYIRSELAKFESVYDISKYSFTNYLENIKAKLQIHQGGADDAVPLEWSREFSQKLDAIDIDNELFVYSGADHNLRPNWDDAIVESLDFFLDNLK